VKYKKAPIIEVVPTNLTKIDNTAASMRLDVGPARAIKAESLLGLCRLMGLKGTGLPQPNPANKSRTDPTGSRCARGFSVTLPNNLAVSSPKKSATLAWENSWIEMDMTKAATTSKNTAGCWKRRLISM